MTSKEVEQFEKGGNPPLYIYSPAVTVTEKEVKRRLVSTMLQSYGLIFSPEAQPR